MKVLITLCLLSFSLNLFAHGSHGHNHHDAPEPMGKAVSEKRLPILAQVYIGNYVQRGALDKSWLKAKHLKSKKQEFKGKKEWIVSFLNEKSSDAKKKKLFVFMRLDGKLIAANFTGK